MSITRIDRAADIPTDNKIDKKIEFVVSPIRIGRGVSIGGGGFGGGGFGGAGGGGGNQEPVQTTWDLGISVNQTHLDNEPRFRVTVAAGVDPNILIDWGDGSSNLVVIAGADTIHEYTEIGNYTIKISGSFVQNGRITIQPFTNGPLVRTTSVIPAIPNIINFQDTFFGQTSLGFDAPLPENLFVNHPNVTSFLNCFRAAYSLGFNFPIPEGLFANNVNATNFQGCFRDCYSLTTIPEGLFANNVNANLFRDCFRDCVELTTIPEGLFANNTSVSTFGFRDCFNGCAYNLTTIPSGLFANNINNLDFQGCFNQCNNLTTIPSGLFANNINVTTFALCFANCPSISAIPAGLFTNNVSVTSFQTCFANQNGDDTILTSIPTGLFDNNINVTTFASTFQDLYTLTTVPSGLFANNVNVTTFGNCFLSVPLTTPSYSNLLINMASNAAARRNNVTFNGGNSKYNTAGATARATLAAKPWTFTDGGPE